MQALWLVIFQDAFGSMLFDGFVSSRDLLVSIWRSLLVLVHDSLDRRLRACEVSVFYLHCTIMFVFF